MGAVYHKSVDFPRGTAENPLTREELIDKFEDCVSYGEKSLCRRGTSSVSFR